METCERSVLQLKMKSVADEKEWKEARGRAKRCGKKDAADDNVLKEA